MSGPGDPPRGARDERDAAREAPVAVTVVWATPDVQDIVGLSLPAGATVADAVARSGLVERHGIDRGATRCGVHGRLVGNEAVLRDGDRVEICRALQVDPKAARRLRAEVRGRTRSVRPPPR
jgi:putative ubiquitin-RnfH superfamily antitoxin RatB of RatAB toxin-antitoxin module